MQPCTFNTKIICIYLIQSYADCQPVLPASEIKPKKIFSIFIVVVQI